MIEPASAAEELLEIDRERIMEMIPHRDPFLLIDKVVDVAKNQRATGIKMVSPEEYYFRGHFPERAVMPGVLIVEAMAQTAGALVMRSLGLTVENRIVYFLTIEKARFRRPVRPGDMLRMPVRALQRRGSVWRFGGQAFVDSALCAEAEFSAMIQDARDGSDGGSSKRDR
jgi:3-hydroxyacyl-[acyl-carrier-protein] dehydratase